MLLENAGAEVIGLTTDVATTNRTMWYNLGISGKNKSLNNYCLNSYDEKRNVFVFSDAPHLIKTIRNRLHDKKLLDFGFCRTAFGKGCLTSTYTDNQGLLMYFRLHNHACSTC